VVSFQQNLISFPLPWREGVRGINMPLSKCLYKGEIAGKKVIGQEIRQLHPQDALKDKIM
jgi:hypothetical protein